MVTTLVGLLAAAWLRTRRPLAERASLLLGVGLVLTAGGLLWSWTLPLNKRLWTDSFVLLTAGATAAVLALLVLAIDIGDGTERATRMWRIWLPFGMNALTAYIFSELLAIVLSVIPVSGYEDLQQFLYRALPFWLGSAPVRSFLYSALFVLVCYVPAWLLYRRSIFLKV
jgi:predicted acyltransferase